jgi:hypothetical protein
MKGQNESPLWCRVELGWTEQRVGQGPMGLHLYSCPGPTSIRVGARQGKGTLQEMVHMLVLHHEEPLANLGPLVAIGEATNRCSSL